jgi:UDPglucose 6-dehydrogenase
VNIVVIGTGYVGLTTAACLSALGHRVVGVDIDKSKLDRIANGDMPIYEIGLRKLVLESLSNGKLRLSSDSCHEVESADFVFLCLPTPMGDNGSADLSAIVFTVNQIREHLPPDVIIVNKSTVPVGSTKMISQLLDNEFAIVSNPEFLREGSAVYDFMNPDRIVIGSDKNEASELVAKIYEDIDCPFVFTDSISAECLKYMSNAFLAVKLSFVNQAAVFCHNSGADVIDVMRGLSLDPRIGSSFLSPGPGWGGSCFPKDTHALSVSASSVSAPMTIVEESIRTNEAHIHRASELINDVARHSNIPNPKIAMLGIAFKANTDDVRDSPAVAVIEYVSNSFKNIAAFDPIASKSRIDHFRVASLDEAIENSDIVVILTEWDHFRNLDPLHLRKKMKSNMIVDLRYILDRHEFQKHGFSLFSLGRKNLSPSFSL